MGIRCLARTTTTPIAKLEARLAQIGAKPSDVRWCPQCTYLLPRAADTGVLQELFVLTLSPADESSGGSGNGGREMCIVSQDGSGSKRVLRAGHSMATVLEQMNTHVQRLRISVEGKTFLCGDFVVRLGQLQLNKTLAGAALEVEYLPCPVAASLASNQPLTAFLDILLPLGERDFDSTAIECLDAVDLPKLFGEEHGALLMVTLMREKFVLKTAGKEIGKDVGKK